MQHERDERELDSAYLDTRYGDPSTQAGYVDSEEESHASIGGAVVAGAATGGMIGAMGAGPVGGAIGAVGGAIVGAVSERLMHVSEENESVTSTAEADIHSHTPTQETRLADESEPKFGSDWGDASHTVIDREIVAPMEADRPADDPHVARADVKPKDQPNLSQR